MLTLHMQSLFILLQSSHPASAFPARRRPSSSTTGGRQPPPQPPHNVQPAARPAAAANPSLSRPIVMMDDLSFSGTQQQSNQHANKKQDADVGSLEIVDQVVDSNSSSSGGSGGDGKVQMELVKDDQLTFVKIGNVNSSSSGEDVGGSSNKTVDKDGKEKPKDKSKVRSLWIP